MYSKNEELIAFIVATEYGWGPFGVCGFERVVFPYDYITVFPLFVGEHHVFVLLHVPGVMLWPLLPFRFQNAYVMPLGNAPRCIQPHEHTRSLWQQHFAAYIDGNQQIKTTTTATIKQQQT